MRSRGRAENDDKQRKHINSQVLSLRQLLSMDNPQTDPLFEQSTPGHIDVAVTHAPIIPAGIDSRHSKRQIRLGVLSFFFVQGIGFASWASRIPDIKKSLLLSDAGLGSVLFALPAGSF